ncbi:ADAM metallopeptidase with thrombospondin type 1, motif [Lignoscripta atroalba]|nr:ADAM metallopeptidase with thrombospondin type 1, motif [Lignoscripta atroalba]
MRSSIIFALPFAAVALAQSSTVVSVTEVTDGQVQATSTTYTNPFTSFLSQTDSLGVVTGQPSVVTSQPSVFTSQPVAETSQPSVITVPAGAPTLVGTVTDAFVTGTLATVVISGSGLPVAGNTSGNTTVSTQPTPSGTVTTRTSSGGASSAAAGTAGSSSPATTTSAGGASMLQPVLGLGFAGALFAAFL